MIKPPGQVVQHLVINKFPTRNLPVDELAVCIKFQLDLYFLKATLISDEDFPTEITLAVSIFYAQVISQIDAGHQDLTTAVASHLDPVCMCISTGGEQGSDFLQDAHKWFLQQRDFSITAYLLQSYQISNADQMHPRQRIGIMKSCGQVNK